MGYSHGLAESDATERLSTAQEVWEFFRNGECPQGRVPAWMEWRRGWRDQRGSRAGPLPAGGTLELVQQQLGTSFPQASHTARHDLPVRVFRNISRN